MGLLIMDPYIYIGSAFLMAGHSKRSAWPMPCCRYASDLPLIRLNKQWLNFDQIIAYYIIVQKSLKHLNKVCTGLLIA